MAYKYSQNPIFPRYYHLDTQPISPIYADKNRQPQKCALTGIRVMTAAYYRNRINTDKRNRVMDQRSDYMFINRKPACLCDIEREDFGTPVRNVERERHPDVNYDCFNNRYFRFSVDDQQPPYDPCSCSYHSIQSDPSTACPSLFEEDRISCPGRLNPRQLSEFRRRRPTSPLVIAEPAEDMTRNPGGLTQMSARSHIWPHNSQAPKTALRAANRSLDELPFNATYNNNTATKSANVNTNNNNNNNGRDDGAKNRSNNGLVVDDAKMARMRRSYRYVPPAPARYPHASTATCDQYEQLGLVLRGNLMLSSTYRENTSTEFRRSYTQDVADRRVAETDEFNMQKDELCFWNELNFMRLRLEANWRDYIARVPTQTANWDRSAKRSLPPPKPPPKKPKTKPQKRPSKVPSKAAESLPEIEFKTPPLSPSRKSSKDLVAVPEYTKDDDFWSFYDQDVK